MKVSRRKVLWLPSRRSVGSAFAWHTAPEILDAFLVRWAWRQLCIGGLARLKLDIDWLALNLLDRGSSTASYG